MNIGFASSAYRSLSLIQWRRSRSVRKLSSSCQLSNWRNETPPGGLTEVLVYSPESQIAWPDTTLGVFAQADPRFVLPGNVGLGVKVPGKAAADDAFGLCQITEATSYSPARPLKKVDILEEKTSHERQAQTLYSAHDYIHFTSGAESYVFSNPVLLETFPAAFADMEACRFELHDAPQLLKKEVGPLFPGVTAFSNAGTTLSVITMARETKYDMSTWSDQVEEERDVLSEQFIQLAKEVCCRLKSDGYWADFIDPSAGIPYYNEHQPNTTMFETDDKYRLLGFRIEDLGCCKVICHKDFGRRVFVGTIFTSVPIGTGVVQDLFLDLNITNLIASRVTQNHQSPAETPVGLSTDLLL